MRVALFPDWETLPYDHFSPHQDLVSERLATLYRVSRGECDVVVVAATTALYRLAPPSYLAAFTFFLQQGERLDVERLRAQLALAGYAHVTQVVSPGEFSVRGGLIDLFPMGSPLPYRIDLFDDEIESIKTFDVDTQRTLYPVRDVRLLPAREFPLDDAGRDALSQPLPRSLRGRPVEVGPVQGHFARRRARRHRVLPAALLRATATLADYLPPKATVVLHGDVTGAVDRFWQDTESRWMLLRGDKARPLLPPTELFLPPDQFNGALKSFARIEFARAGKGPTAPLPPVQVDRRADDPLAALKRFLATTDARVAIVAESPGRRETMQQYFARIRPAPRAGRRLRRVRARHRARRAGRVPAGVRLRVAGRGPGVRDRGRALRERRAPQRARIGAALERRRDGARPLRGAHRRSRRPRAARHRPLPRDS